MSIMGASHAERWRSNPPIRLNLQAMIDKTDRILRDAIRKSEQVKVSWTNGPCQGFIASSDRQFIFDLANAYARMCDRREQKRKEYGKSMDTGRD